MANINIPGDILTKVSVLGGSAPDTGYYAATVTGFEAHATRVGSLKMSLAFAMGFGCFDWVNSAFDANGNQLPGLSDKQVRGRTAAFKTILVSAGFTNDQFANGATDDWLIGKTVYVEWHSAKDLGGQYGEIDGYVTQAQFDNANAEGRKPAVAGAGAAATTGGSTGAAPSISAGVPAPAKQAVAPNPAAASPAQANGAGRPTAGVALPPAPSTAQSLVS